MTETPVPVFIFNKQIAVFFVLAIGAVSLGFLVRYVQST